MVSACATDEEPSAGGAVIKVDCGAATPVRTITAPGNRFAPDVATVAPGDVVRFEMPGAHNAVSDDGLFEVDFGATACLRFDQPGTYGFLCEPHRFRGSIVVQ